MTALKQIANVGVEDARTLRVSAYDAGLIKDIERAITAANLGVGTSSDGTSVRVYAFVMVLGYSRYLYVEFTRSMALATLIRCHQNAFAFFGGWPRRILYDNMRQVVVGPNDEAASIAFLLRIFLGPLASARQVWEPMLAVIAVLTLTIGNLAAMNQTNIKRLLAYSSISHAGYMLLGLVAGNQTGINGIAVYIMVYTFMNLGAFLVVVALRRQNIIGEDLDDMAGLMHKSPGYAILMLIFLLSLAGIPPTAGFLGKYYIFLALIQTGHYTLAVVATLYVAVAIYYYFKIVRSMFTREETEKAPMATSFGLRLALGASGFFIATAIAEERENLVGFGAAYAGYMKRTRRFIPFLF